MASHDPIIQRQQLAEQRRKVDFDTYDVTVDELIRRVERARIEIAPIYQRQFRWDAVRQSRLIESFLLGIPVPPLFMATNQTPGQQTQWEVVDGLQRLLTLVNFAGDADARNAAKLVDPPLLLTGLEKLPALCNMPFAELPADIRTALEDRPVKVVVLNDKSDMQVRFDLFERLNTGGLKLTDQEVRECVFRGPFMDLLSELAAHANFRTVVHLPKNNWKDGTPEDYVLRFFAFMERYQSFEHSVKTFLNDFAQAKAKNPNITDMREIFVKSFNYLAAVFPTGIKSRKGMTPVNLFEAVSVGAALAIQENPDLAFPDTVSWLHSSDLRHLTTGATNSRLRVKGRIEFCRDRFLGVQQDV
ncbi:MAG: DUF262 domain-containing protein [Proteobacteria bacterium]|nr:DUF262 domain-containing protein [Pseudomonadota bacterium]MBU1547566.1 DUF262 domain-containing protein [Pseudomonadota bacterium]MBU2619848.1 DUF262 domain-containing protein [Pseudomonadota bacterium]